MGWQLGTAAKSLFGIDWSTQWHCNLIELRNELNLPKDTAVDNGISGTPIPNHH